MAIQEIHQRPPGPRVLSVNGKKVNDARYAEVPQMDFQLSLPKAVTEHLPQPPRFTVRLWRSIRRLIRRRQESQAVRDARLDSIKAKRDAAKQVADITLKLTAKDNQIKELEGRLATKAREVCRLEDSDIQRLKNNISVLEDEVRLLAAKHERELAREKAEIAVHNQRIVGSDEAGNWQRRMLVD